MTVEITATRRWVATSVYLERGHSYRLSASGIWFDAGTPHGPSGATDDARQFGHRLGDLWSWLAQKLPAKPREPFPFSPTKRVATAPWFSLIGTVANRARADEAERDINQHTTFLIGDGMEVGKDTARPLDRGGYLYCFANDAWGFYGNNSGSVALEIGRFE